MGPQLDSCGRRVSTKDADAIDELQWGRNLIVAEGTMPSSRLVKHKNASMGPQLDSCGRQSLEALGQVGRIELQWGRNLIVAEGRMEGLN